MYSVLVDEGLYNLITYHTSLCTFPYFSTTVVSSKLANTNANIEWCCFRPLTYIVLDDLEHHLIYPDSVLK